MCDAKDLVIEFVWAGLLDDIGGEQLDVGWGDASGAPVGARCANALDRSARVFGAILHRSALLEGTEFGAIFSPRDPFVGELVVEIEFVSALAKFIGVSDTSGICGSSTVPSHAIQDIGCFRIFGDGEVGGLAAHLVGVVVVKQRLDGEDAAWCFGGNDIKESRDRPLSIGARDFSLAVGVSLDIDAHGVCAAFESIGDIGDIDLELHGAAKRGDGADKLDGGGSFGRVGGGVEMKIKVSVVRIAFGGPVVSGGWGILLPFFKGEAGGVELYAQNNALKGSVKEAKVGCGLTDIDIAVAVDRHFVEDGDGVRAVWDLGGGFYGGFGGGFYGGFGGGFYGGFGVCVGCDLSGGFGGDL